MSTMGGTWHQEGRHGAGTVLRTWHTTRSEGGTEEGKEREGRREWARDREREGRRERRTDRKIGRACHGAWNLNAHWHSNIPPNPSQVNLGLKIEYVNMWGHWGHSYSNHHILVQFEMENHCFYFCDIFIFHLIYIKWFTGKTKIHFVSNWITECYYSVLHKIKGYLRRIGGRRSTI